MKVLNFPGNSSSRIYHHSNFISNCLIEYALILLLKFGLGQGFHVTTKFMNKPRATSEGGRGIDI